MALILRSMSAHSRLMGETEHWSDEDWVVLDGYRSVGRIHKDRSQSSLRGSIEDNFRKLTGKVD
jgi:hypothetical protein